MLNVNVEVNLKTTHLTYKSTMKQKIKLKEIKWLKIDKYSLGSGSMLDPAQIRPIFRSMDPDPDP